MYCSLSKSELSTIGKSKLRPGVRQVNGESIRDPEEDDEKAPPIRREE